MVAGFKMFRAYDPAEALEVIRRRHPHATGVSPLSRGQWSYTATNLQLGALDIGRQSTTGFSGGTGRDEDGLRLIVVSRGAVVSRVGSIERTNDAAHGFGFLHPEQCGTFSNGYASVALRIPFGRIRSALAQLDCELDPLRFVEHHWGRSDLPGRERFQSILNTLLLFCEEGGPLTQVEAFTRAQEQIFALHLAELIAARRASDPVGCDTRKTVSLRACIDFIDAHSHDQFELGAMASYAGISLRTAQAQFARHLGTTISDHLRSVRLNKVRSRLSTNGEDSVTNAAFEEGFSHLGEFSRWYTRRFAEKPSETLRHTRMRRLI